MENFHQYLLFVQLLSLAVYQRLLGFHVLMNQIQWCNPPDVQQIAEFIYETNLFSLQLVRTPSYPQL